MLRVCGNHVMRLGTNKCSTAFVGDSCELKTTTLFFRSLVLIEMWFWNLRPSNFSKMIYLFILLLLLLLFFFFLFSRRRVLTTSSYGDYCKLHCWAYFHTKFIGNNIVGAHYNPHYWTSKSHVVDYIYFY